MNRVRKRNLILSPSAKSRSLFEPMDRFGYPQLILLLFGLSLTYGCHSQRVQIATAQSDADQVQTEQTVQDQLESAMEFVQDYDQYQEDAVLGRVLHNLRKWSEPQKPDATWIADPLYSRMPDRLNLAKNPALLSSMAFGRNDVELLRESLWLRDLAQRLSSVAPNDESLSAWLDDEPSGSLSKDDIESLRKVAVIFDWVVCNVQIEPSDLSSEEGGNVDAKLLRPGTRRSAFEALLLGRGDPLVRGRLALLIARQIGIPCVMIGPSGEQDPPPWWLAAIIGSDLYLFDPQNGLVVPGPQGVGIATLRQVVEDPTILTQLSVGEAHPYRVSPSDLHDLTISIDASRDALSQRMHLVEKRLPSDYKLVLTTSPAELRLRVKDHPGVTQIAIWSQPYDLLALRMELEKSPILFERLNRDLVPLLHPWPLALARRQHVRGHFSDDDFEPGARQLYLKMRLSEARRQGINTPRKLDEVLTEILGSQQALPSNPKLLAEIAGSTQEILKVTKSHATFWLGLIAMEVGDYEVAVDYFRTRTLEANTDGLWTVGAKYNLGRALESLGRSKHDASLLKSAAEAYLSETDSPQGAGNRWRAARVTKAAQAP